MSARFFKGICIHLAKAKTSFNRSRIRRDELRSNYETKENAELVRIVKDDGIFGAREEERQAALAVLRKRQEAMNARTGKK
ncbi:hypothetical protein [Pseudomonas lopnurensis]|uniref:hypothetical protein n=1 Tax=Pseudomonas lopnurensis TaxID=1477517 RepID=UPI001879C0F2|nr:hypothetical protein [Pseudomonas lopnurensis]MBE7374575.1 hypothetical protein [Pseudomonas lopnurensis]